MTVLEATQGISLDIRCGFGGENAVSLLEQLQSGKYREMSVLEIPRTVEDWRSEHRTARKRADRAYKRGYVTDNLGFTGGSAFDEINQSAAERQGRPMGQSYLNPRSFSQLPEYPCPLHATRVSGCYGTDGGLVAYIVIQRAGELALVSQILGHKRVLKDEIMSLLFQHALGRETFAPGLMVYNRHDSGWTNPATGRNGLQDWKEWHGFEERLVEWLP